MEKEFALRDIISALMDTGGGGGRWEGGGG
jgi:hypothetical protein